MAIIETQIRKDVFLDVIKAELIRFQVPWEVVNKVAEAGKLLNNQELLIERIEFPEVTVASATPKLGQAPKGELYIQVKIQLFLTTYNNAMLAGHLGIPATLPSPFEMTIWIRIRYEKPPVLQITYQVVDSDGTFGEFIASGTLNLDIPLPIGIKHLWNTAILAKDDVIAIRLGTDLEDGTDNSAFLDWWGGNRLGMSQWGVFIAGTVVGHEIANILNAAAEQLAINDSRIKVTYPNIEPNKMIPHDNGAWNLPQRYAEASVKLQGIDGGLLGTIEEFIGFDVSVVIAVKVEMQPYLGTALKLKTRIEWDAPDAANGKISDSVRNAFLGQDETAHGDNFVEYSRTFFPESPRSHAYYALITSANVDDYGIAITGSLQVRPRPSTIWSVSPPSWTYSGDCHTKSVGIKFKPASVLLVGNDPYFEPLLLMLPISKPLLFFEPFNRRSMVGALPVTLEVEFRPAGSLLGDVPSGIIESAFLYTNLGVRWINFGVVPPKPVVNDKELLGRTAVLISNCMAISDLWGMGVMNLGWLVDPPDLAVDFGLPPLLEWFVLGNDVREVDTVQLTAIRRDGQRRSLGTASAAGGMLMLHQIVTDANETLELRTDTPMAGSAPRVMRRWIAPQRIIPFERTVTSFALDGPFLNIFYEDGSIEELQIDGDLAATVYHVAEEELMLRGINRADQENIAAVGNFATLVSRHSYYIKTAPKSIIESSGSVAVLHDNKIILGVAGRFKPAVGSGDQEKTGMAPTMPYGKNG